MVWVLVILGFGASGLDTRAAPVTIWNEVTGNGSLRVTTDDYGSFGDAFAGGPFLPDFFDPSPDPIAGELHEGFPTFRTGLYVSIDPSGVGNGTHRGFLSTSSPPGDATLMGIVTKPNTLIDVGTCASAFEVTGAGVRVGFTLTQRVSPAPDGPNGERVAKLEQTYVMTNLMPEPLNFIVTKHVDQDMPWGPGQPFHVDDLVGMDVTELGRPEAISRDGALLTVMLRLRTREDMTENAMTTTHPVTGASSLVYYAGKQGLDVPPGNPDFPGGQCPRHDYGTDSEIWNNYGVPNCWKNYVPAAGYDVPGMSPDVAGDAHMGLQLEAALTTGSPYEVTFVTLYGYGPEAVFGDGDADGDVDGYDFELFVSCYSGEGTPYPPEEACPRFDSDADGDVDLHDFGLYQRVHAGG